MFCSYCGTAIPAGTYYCANCGARVGMGTKTTVMVHSLYTEVKAYHPPLLSAEGLFHFDGRRSRKPYNLLNLGLYLCLVPISALSRILPQMVVAIMMLAVYYVALTNMVRRLHDCDMSALWVIFYPIMWIYLTFKRGTVGRNKYGYDPNLQKEALKELGKTNPAEVTIKDVERLVDKFGPV